MSSIQQQIDEINQKIKNIKRDTIIHGSGLSFHADEIYAAHRLLEIILGSDMYKLFDNYKWHENAFVSDEKEESRIAKYRQIYLSQNVKSHDKK